MTLSAVVKNSSSIKCFDKALLTVFVIASLMVAVVIAFWVVASSLKASDKLLYQIAILKPGSNLNEVVDRLGHRLIDTDDPDYMMNVGPVKSHAFCQDKKLFVFYSSDPPSRGLVVYTDTNNRILFVTWQSL